MKRRIFFGGIIILFLLVCGYCSYHKLKTTEVLPRAIDEKLGDKVSYQGKSDKSKAQLCYRYLLNEEDKGVICDVTVAVNEVIKQQEVNETVQIRLCYEVPGALGNGARLCNYKDDNQPVSDCNGLQRLVIIGNDEEDSECIFNNPASYSALPNTKYLEISEKIQAIAEEKGIDWYEYWPDLESVEVFE